MEKDPNLNRIEALNSSDLHNPQQRCSRPLKNRAHQDFRRYYSSNLYNFYYFLHINCPVSRKNFLERLKFSPLGLKSEKYRINSNLSFRLVSCFEEGE
jgi:hypothetical protein